MQTHCSCSTLIPVACRRACPTGEAPARPLDPVVEDEEIEEVEDELAASLDGVKLELELEQASL